MYDFPMKDPRPAILLVFDHSSWFCIHEVIYFILFKIIFTIQSFPHNIQCCVVTANLYTCTPERLMKRKTQDQFKVWLQCFWDIHWCIDLHKFLNIYVNKVCHIVAMFQKYLLTLPYCFFYLKACMFPPLAKRHKTIFHFNMSAHSFDTNLPRHPKQLQHF